jgi:hypothetical protein
LKNLKVWQLVLILIVVVGGSILFVGGVSGWFSSSQVEIDAEYRCEKGNCGFQELSPEEYEKLIDAKKSFVVFVDQGGCTTADKLKEYTSRYADEKGLKPYKIMFEEMKETSLHDSVKYYPSFVIISRGKVIGWLRGDSDEDSNAYNNYDDFLEWVSRYIR